MGVGGKFGLFQGQNGSKVGMETPGPTHLAEKFPLHVTPGLGLLFELLSLHFSGVGRMVSLAPPEVEEGKGEDSEERGAGRARSEIVSFLCLSFVFFFCLSFGFFFVSFFL